MNGHDTHNTLAREFVLMAGTRTRNSDELMVLTESLLLASMHLLVRLYAVKPAHASALMEAALQNATERFSSPPNTV